MHDHIARIHQHPVALGLAIDRPGTITGFFQPPRQRLRHGAHMTRGAARSDHRGVAQSSTAFQIDGDDILCLVILKRRQDALEQIALRRGFLGGNNRLLDGSGWFLGGRFLGDGFLDGLFGFLGRDFLGGFDDGFFAGRLFGSFASQG